MTIVTIAGKYFIPVENGFREISFMEAMGLYESGAITHEEVIEYD